MEHGIGCCVAIFDTTNQFLFSYFFGYVWHTYRYAIYLFCSGLSWKCVEWTDTKNKTGNVIYMDHYSANC